VGRDEINLKGVYPEEEKKDQKSMVESGSKGERVTGESKDDQVQSN